MAEHSHLHSDDSHDLSHHIHPISMYLKVYGILMALMGLTIWASYWHLPVEAMNVALALIIAVIKAVLVVLFFMGVKYQTKLTWIWASIGFVWFLLMFGTLADYVTRDWIKLSGW